MRPWNALRNGLLFAVLAALAAGAADDKDKDGGKAALAGTWQTVASEMDGEKQPEDDVKAYTLVFAGDKLTVNKSGDLVMKGSVTLDASQNPRHLDLKLEENPNNPDDVGKTLPGIYELKGDELKWCFALPGASGDRPKAFKTEAGSGQVSATLKREKK